MGRTKLISSKKGTLLLIDFLNLFYKGFCVHSALEHKGVNTGGLYGMATQLANLLIKIKPDHVVFCHDNKPYFRSVDFPNYKVDRKNKKKDIARYKAIQVGRKLCLEFIDILGIPLMESAGLEADDIIALMVKKYHTKYAHIIVASNDDDLYQLLCFTNLQLYRGSKKGMYSHVDFAKEFPSLDSPSQWNDAVAYSGGHNGLPGIKGVGVATAIRIITEEDFLYNRPQIKAAVVRGKNIIDLNRKLGKLPYYRCSEEVLMRLLSYSSNYDERAVIRYLISYGIIFTQNMMDAFIRPYRGTN